MKFFIVFCFIGLFSDYVKAQEPVIRFIVIDAVTKEPLDSVSVILDGKLIGQTDAAGRFQHFAGHLLNKELRFLAAAYELKKVKNFLSDGINTIALEKTINKQEEVVIVSSTRNNQKMENSPLKVEVLGREEMDEENTIKPANIASILGDVSGVQIQQTSATTGNANVRIQGLGGQYTQILKDGMPLFEGFSGGFGVLSIPPLDLKQVELIKGSASTLYGGGAIGGLVNIISRKPTAKQDAVLTLNASTLKEKNVNFYLAKKYSKTGYTVFGGYTDQQAQDVNKDGFSDVATTQAFIIHPRFFFYPSKNTTFSIGNNTVLEKRTGGDMNYIRGIYLIGGLPFYEKNVSTRNTTEFLLNQALPGTAKLEIKSSYSSFDREIKTQLHQFNGLQKNLFSEASLLLPYRKNNFVAGINYLKEAFQIKPSQPVLFSGFSNATLGFFVQQTINFSDKTILEAGIRDDITNHYGNFLLPRIAFMHHLNNFWGLRAGIGFGYKTPNILNNQIADVPIQKILPLASGVRAEKSIGYNAEINYKYTWDNNELFINHAFFLTNITQPVVSGLNVSGQTFFYNAAKSINAKGFDTYIKLQLNQLELYAGFTYTIATRNYIATGNLMPFTPKTRAAFVVVREFESTGFRVGLEGSYNGFQYRDDGTKTPDYLFMAGLIEKKFAKHFTIVLNCENILDYRQSKKEALYSGTLSNPQFKTLWAPIDGRVLNLAFRYSIK
jgi:iron complex outermembrane receptor protein/outer membrane receptor for ferrienterochelin and colicins